MKVVIVTNLYPLPWEPNRATFNKHQFRWLSRNNEVLILVLVSWIAAFKHRHLMQREKIGNITVSYVPYFFTPKVFRFSYGIWVFLALLLRWREIRAFSPKVMLCSWAFPDGVGAALLGKIMRLPVVLKVHGSDVNEYLQSYSRRLQILWAVRQAKAVIAVSQALRNTLVESGADGNKVHVVYNGVDKTIFRAIASGEAATKLGVAPDRHIILFVGNLKRDKGCMTLLEAYKPLAESDGSLDLVYIGQGECRELIKAESERAGLSQRVKLLGSLNQEQIALWMNVSKLVALPSKNEGVPNVLLEAMSCGTPVVATRVGGIPEVVAPSCGVLCELGNQEHLTAALREVLGTLADRAGIEACMADKSWDVNVARVEAILS